MRYLFLILYCCLGMSLALAQDFQAVDADTASVTTTANVKVSDLTARQKYLNEEIRRCTAQYQPELDSIQSQLDQMAIANVQNAVPLASASAQATIAAQPVTATPTPTLDTQGTATVTP